MPRKEPLAKRIANDVRWRFTEKYIAQKDIETLIAYVLTRQRVLSKRDARKNEEDDLRNHHNTAHLLQSTPSYLLKCIVVMGDAMLKRALQKGIGDFLNIPGTCRFSLSHLPPSWVRGGARILLNEHSR